jgi:hypothetical protein
VFQNPQTELVNFITDSGLTPTDSDLHQLSESVQTSRVMFGVDVGSANAIAVNLVPPLLAYRQGMCLRVLVANTVTEPTTINCNALGTKVALLAGTALSSGVLTAGDIGEFIYDGTNFQLIGGSRGGTLIGPVYLSASQTYYVNGTTGSDSFDGLTATVTGGHGPFATIQKACNVINGFNLNGFDVTVNVANGTYAPFSCSPIGGSGNIRILGNLVTPVSCSIDQPGSSSSAAITASGSNYTFAGFKLTASGGGIGLDCINGGSNYYYNMEFGACGTHIQVSGGAILNALATGITGAFKRVTGSATFHILLTASSKHNVDVGPFQALTLVGTPAFTAWSNAQAISLDRELYSSITGSATGQRYLGAQNSIIDTNGGGATYLPGNAAGSLSSGAQYT